MKRQRQTNRGRCRQAIKEKEGTTEKQRKIGQERQTNRARERRKDRKTKKDKRREREEEQERQTNRARGNAYRQTVE